MIGKNFCSAPQGRKVSMSGKIGHLFGEISEQGARFLAIAVREIKTRKFEARAVAFAVGNVDDGLLQPLARLSEGFIRLAAPAGKIEHRFTGSHRLGALRRLLDGTRIGRSRKMQTALGRDLDAICNITYEKFIDKRFNHQTLRGG